MSINEKIDESRNIVPKGTEGERGGEKKTCFFSFLSQSPFPTPFGGLLQTEEDACCAGTFHNNPIIILHFTTWHKLNNVSGCVNIQHWFHWTAGPAVTPHLSQEVFLVLWFEPILTHWLFLLSDDSPAHPVEMKVIHANCLHACTHGFGTLFTMATSESNTVCTGYPSSMEYSGSLCVVLYVLQHITTNSILEVKLLLIHLTC